MRNTLNKKLDRLDYLGDEISELKEQLTDTENLLEDTEKALIIMQQAAKISQAHLAGHLSLIVTQAIQTVLNKPYEFVCEFVERRGSTEADLYLTKGGEKFDILGGTGGGLADVISFSLKIAYLLLSNVDRVLIIDEVSRHINSPMQRENFARVLKKLSREFEIQLILNTTIPELLQVADKIITLTQVNEITEVEQRG